MLNRSMLSDPRGDRDEMLDRRLPDLRHRRGVQAQHIRCDMAGDQLLPSRMQRIFGSGAEHRVFAEHQHRPGPWRKATLQVLGQGLSCHGRISYQQKSAAKSRRSEPQQHKRAILRDTACAETNETLRADVIKVAEPSMAYRRRWRQALPPNGNAVLHRIEQRIAGHAQQTKRQGGSHARCLRRATLDRRVVRRGALREAMTQRGMQHRQHQSWPQEMRLWPGARHDLGPFRQQGRTPVP